MKIYTTICTVLVLISTSCSKDEVIAPEPEPEPVAQVSADAIPYFHETTAYFYPNVYRYDDSIGLWGNRIVGHFSVVSTDDPTFLGFANPYVKDSGVNLFQMVTLYSAFTGTSNIKVAGINVEKLLQFLPDAGSAAMADAPTVKSQGKVIVVNQKVKIYKPGGETREEMEFIEIGLSGEGTYDLNTGVIDLNVHFDETAIGGEQKVTRKYKISKTALTL